MDSLPVHALDHLQPFASVTPYEVRATVEELVRRDLLGPWEGEREQFPPRGMGPRERYLVGMLGPRPRPRAGIVNDAGVPETDVGVSGDARENELPEIVTPQSLGRIWASSMGLSFAVDASADAVRVEADWGEYGKREVEIPESEKKTLAWVREPIKHGREVRLDGARSQRIQLLGGGADQPGVLLAVEVRARDSQRVVELTLINTQPEPPTTADTAWLFQTQLTVLAVDGESAIFQPIDDPLDSEQVITGDTEEAHLRLLYRNQRRYAAGRNVAVHAVVPDGERRAVKLLTAWVPFHDVPDTIAPVGPGTALAEVELGMDALAVLSPQQLREGLGPLVTGYRSWLEVEAAKVPGLPELLRSAAQAALYAAGEAAGRIEAGIKLLSDPFAPGHDQALAAFRFANQAMAGQRRQTAIGRLRAEEGLSFAEATAEVAGRGVGAASWRPFQLAFVLLNLPSLTDPAHPERAADRSATVDLLFFPTGGGKTEAYLGLTAYTFAIRRLQGVVGLGANARDGGGGVAVLMRYTLRLLTAQQFQRAATLVCAAELIRRQDAGVWGEEPFRIGMWVGGRVSPNWYPEAEAQVTEARGAGNSKGTNALQTLACPWCGTPLLGHRDLHPVAATRRVLLFCSNAEDPDACPFSRRLSPEGLPILTVDEEIYRYAPSLLIATVDKLAQLPWKGYTGILFGRVDRRCARHGYRHDDLDDKTGCTAQRHPPRNGLPAAETTKVLRLRPPDLIIQDELHLISGALGTTVGLFEAAVDELCTWAVPDDSGSASGATRLTGPKIVASTATTRRAAQQVLGVFGRDLAIFPPQVIDVEDTFFSEQVPITPEHPGRRYLGICAHGVRFKSAQIRVAEILLIAGQTAMDRFGEAADPYMTLVGYFNATRELAGMRRYLDDDVATRVRTHGAPKGLSNRILRRTDLLGIQELTQRISSGDISEVLKRLEIRFDADLDTSVRKPLIRQNVSATLDERRKSRSKRDEKQAQFHPLGDRWSERQRGDTTPVDVVLATSMLQVGVDVSRFGLMVVTGQPKNTAEYIQASSRVGRDPGRPGLVVTLYNWARPRDLAHFEDFEHYHATFYRQVEALSVTPFTRRALDRGTAGMFVAAVRNTVEENSRNVDAQDVDLSSGLVEATISRMLDRAEAVDGPRGRAYLGERVEVLLDRWQFHSTGEGRLGYDTKITGQNLTRGLLIRAGIGPWGALTVGQSMRETENEINLLVPGGDQVYEQTFGAPTWSFGPGGQSDEDDETPSGDELGVSQLDPPGDPVGSGSGGAN